MMNMKKETPDSAAEDDEKIAKFLLRDTLSLRNEIKFTALTDMVHPLTYTENIKKHPNMHMVPLMDKYQDEEFIKLFYRVYK